MPNPLSDQRYEPSAVPAPVTADRFKRQLLACSCMLLLASCGGGGGGADAQPQPIAPEPPPVTPVTPRVTPTVTPPTPPSAALLVAPGKWVIMGSSTAAGEGATSQSWATRLQTNYRSLSVEVVNIARGGTTTYAGLPGSTARVAGRPPPDPLGNVDAALSHSPKLVLVAYPSNDTSLDYSVDETVRNLLAIRSSLQARGAAVMILSTQPANLSAAKLALLPQIDSRVSAAAGPCFVPVREALAAPDGTLSPTYDNDGVHPNEAGHALIYSKVASVIDSGRCVRTR